MFISELFLHPVKSAAAIQVEHLLYDQQGPIHDREWMLVNASGKFISQRTSPKMCFIQAKLEGHELLLDAPEQETLRVAQMPNSINDKGRRVTVWKDEFNATDCGDQAAQWLTQLLGKECRLVQLSKHSQRLVDTNFAHAGQTVGFADGFPSLIVSQASLDQFNSHLASPVDMRRFRPNIVISGCQPYAEDDWRTIRINGIEFDLVKPCSRCIMPSINPDTADKEMQINEALLQTRRRGRDTYFGQNALHRGVGEIKVGDAVELIA